MITPPTRRVLQVWPRQAPANKPDLDNSQKSPEQRHNERAAINAAKPPGVRLDFRCHCRVGTCPGHLDVDDAALVRFVCNTGFCVAIETAADAWARQVAAATKAEEAAGR